MPHIVTALFRDRAKARGALMALLEKGIARDRITFLGSGEIEEVTAVSGERSREESQDNIPGILTALHLPPEDYRFFEVKVRGGNSLIAARVDKSKVDEAANVLDMFDPLDLDTESREAASRSDTGDSLQAPLGTGITGGNAEGMTNTGALPGMNAMANSTDDLGTEDVETAEAVQGQMGQPSTVSTGGRKADERAEREGVNESLDFSPALDARSGPMQRQINRGGRVWAYAIEEPSLGRP